MLGKNLIFMSKIKMLKSMDPEWNSTNFSTYVLNGNRYTIKYTAEHAMNIYCQSHMNKKMDGGGGMGKLLGHP